MINVRSQTNKKRLKNACDLNSKFARFHGNVGCRYTINSDLAKRFFCRVHTFHDPEGTVLEALCYKYMSEMQKELRWSAHFASYKSFINHVWLFGNVSVYLFRSIFIKAARRQQFWTTRCVAFWSPTRLEETAWIHVTILLVHAHFCAFAGVHLKSSQTRVAWPFLRLEENAFMETVSACFISCILYCSILQLIQIVKIFFLIISF